MSELVSLRRHDGRTGLQDLGHSRRTTVFVTANPFAIMVLLSCVHHELCFITLVVDTCFSSMCGTCWD